MKDDPTEFNSSWNITKDDPIKSNRIPNLILFKILWFNGILNLTLSKFQNLIKDDPIKFPSLPKFQNLMKDDPTEFNSS